MKTMTENEVREHWGETLASLAAEKEVLITSGDRVVARLLPVGVEETKPRKKFDPEEQRRWRDEFWGEGVMVDSLSGLLADREERDLIPTLDAEALEKWRTDFAAGRVFDTTASLVVERDSRSTR